MTDEVAVPRVSWREIADRFTHIDAELIEAACFIGRPGSKLVVRFYPFWEHPRARDPRASRQPLDMLEYEALKRNVTVFPIGLHAFKLSDGGIEDWAFTTDHPLVWRYRQAGSITCNSEFDPTELVEEIMRSSPAWARTHADVYRLVGRQPQSAPFALPPMARAPFDSVRSALRRMGVRTHCSFEPEASEKPVALLLEDGDFIVADDFEIELPEFEHPPELYRVYEGVFGETEPSGDE